MSSQKFHKVFYQSGIYFGLSSGNIITFLLLAIKTFLHLVNTSSVFPVKAPFRVLKYPKGQNPKVAGFVFSRAEYPNLKPELPIVSFCLTNSFDNQIYFSPQICLR